MKKIQNKDIVLTFNISNRGCKMTADVRLYFQIMGIYTIDHQFYRSVSVFHVKLTSNVSIV